VKKYRLRIVLIMAVLGVAAIGCGEDDGREYYTAQMSYTEYEEHRKISSYKFHVFTNTNAMFKGILDDTQRDAFLLDLPYDSETMTDEDVMEWLKDTKRGAFNTSDAAAMKAFLDKNEQCYIITRTGGTRIDILVQKKLPEPAAP